MKYLKYILGIVAILVIVFFLLGIIKPELSYNCEIMVDKPLAESWAVSQDVEKMSDWLVGFQKFEHVSGTPNTIGAVSDVYFITDGQEMVIRETITGIVPNESVSMSFTSDFMDMDYILSMVSIDGKTKVRTSTKAKGNGIISKSIMALMENSMETQEETNLSHLQKTIENNTKNYVIKTEDSIQINNN
ncbi:SRPBCC family protein [uncultured Lacinutrix sp.]|uniref:SRPBCC family protein n=1 Tax=uncultured Lacinutrix sp. TaxID=574032 RepID=UPI0026394C11|nr:SRPBCC family protein [uncultured Lacinutrix sp.]